MIGGSDARAITDTDEALVFWTWRERRPDVEMEDLLKWPCYEANAGQAPVGSNIEALFYATAAFSLGRLLRRIVLILLLFVSRNKRLRNDASDKVSSNRLVRSKPQGRLR